MRRSTCPLILLMLALSGAAAPLHGQLVRGQVIDSITGTPVQERVVILEGPDGTEADRASTCCIMSGKRGCIST